MFKKTFSLTMTLFMSNLMVVLSGCNQPPGTTTSTVTTPPAATWNPPPLMASCTAGDADQDGSCDNVDPDPNAPDTDQDGELDGMDTAPVGHGGGDGSWDSGDWLSNLSWGLAAVAGTSVLYNIFAGTGSECQTTSILGTVQCIEPDWSKATVEFHPTNDAGGQMIIRNVKVTVHRKHWFLYRFDLGDDYEGNIEYRYNYLLEPGLIDNANYVPCSNSDYYRCLGAPTGDVVGTGLVLYLDKNGCDGKKFPTDAGTGALITFDDPSTKSPYCLDWNAIEGYPRLFDEARTDVMAFFNSAYQPSEGQWNEDKLVLRPVDATKPLALPVKSMPFSRDKNNSIPTSLSNFLADNWK